MRILSDFFHSKSTIFVSFEIYNRYTATSTLNQMLKIIPGLELMKIDIHRKNNLKISYRTGVNMDENVI